MSFDWREYLNLGLVLNGLQPQNFTQEAALRSSVSRIYYSCYHIALDYAVTNYSYRPIKGKKAGRNHLLVRVTFKKNKRTNIFRRLDHLHRWRKACDYDDQVVNLQQMVRNSIYEAREIIRQL
jgi:uncharacterized protein (UPF0332 family)